MTIYDIFDRLFAWINQLLGEPVEEVIPIVQDLPKKKTGIGDLLGSLIPDVAGTVSGSAGVIGPGTGVISSAFVPAFITSWAIGFGSEAYRFFSNLGEKSKSEFYDKVSGALITQNPVNVNLLKRPG